MRYDTKKIKQEAKKDYLAYWKKTSSMFPSKSPQGFKERLLKPGPTTRPEPHLIQNLAQKIRGNFLRLGFTEVENPLFVEEQDVYKQYGPEGPAILDRCYYLAGLPRPDIGLSDSKISSIKKKIPSFKKPDAENLKNILRDYKLGRIEGDDLVDTIAHGLAISNEDATNIIDIFAELKNLKPEPTTTTLRSHMTAAWFPTIAALQDKMEQPIKLFSIGLRFRREQKVDATHLRAHYGASCVVVDENMNMEAGKALAEEIMKPLGFKEFSFINKETTSTYYAHKSEYEVFAKSKGGESIEIADIGMYSPLALANYDIELPVFNAGFGLERLIMVANNISDVRQVMFPQFYVEKPMTDEEIAADISIERRPKTAEAKKLSKAISTIAQKKADSPSPCEFQAYSGSLGGKKIIVDVLEPEEGTSLLGPAALNEIYVYNGGIFGLPKDASKFKEAAVEIKERGTKTGITYLDAISDFFAARIEEALEKGSLEKDRPYQEQIKMAKTAPDINIKISDRAVRFIQSKNKEIKLKGPIFTTVRARVV